MSEFHRSSSPNSDCTRCRTQKNAVGRRAGLPANCRETRAVFEGGAFLRPGKHVILIYGIVKAAPIRPIPQWFSPPAFGGETQGGAGQLAGCLPTEPRPLPGGRGSAGACRTRRQDSPFAGRAASKIWNIPMLPPRQSPLIGSLMSARTINPSLRPSARESGS